MIEKRALITGAGRRLGQAMATCLGARGFKVAIHYRSSKEGAQQTLDAVRQAGGDGAIVQADLKSEADLASLVQTSSNLLSGPLGLLVNNASAFEEDGLQSHTFESWDKHMAINLRAPIALSQAFAAQIDKDAKGLIVNLVDQRVWKLNPTFFSYTLSKSALWTATQTMAQALAPNIRVNGIGPGPTLQNERQSTADFQQQVDATLTGEGSSPEEICKALLYFLDAEAVTGQMLAVDGGQHLVWKTPDIDGVVE
ncbi:SDR family oxidoreductase [Hirschia baltica]|uniref:Short-chain dehydrogenase/reductase SDR n=1 Tax=Hirschia baltica (strain ATCC 49814 / DSM 5838 / IFAM 1418) TaxID=582402 RepID=C6XM77_HIRBI|nr:SDR family oxidoreductase [Hirschia baltica]ACT58020.1 short-chain dehydrogenase/reductase SDR [Hirschia baltica ATCC 49814]